MTLDRLVLTVARLGFAGIIGFETFGLLGYTSFTPTYSWISLLVTAVGAWVLFEGALFYLRKYYAITIPGIFCLVLVSATFFDAAGDLLHLYKDSRYYDNALHFLAGLLLMGPFSGWIIHKFNARSAYFIRPLVAAYLIVTFATFTGFLYELGEYLADAFLGTESIPDRVDSVEDMISNALGGALFAFFFARHQVRRKEFTPTPL